MQVLDTEIYKNYFLICAECLQTGKITTFEFSEYSEIDKKLLRDFLLNNTIITFNGNNFDLPLMLFFIYKKDPTVGAIKDFADDIILGKRPGFRLLDDRGFKIDVERFNHIDLFEVAPGKASLKIYGGRLGAPSLEELPYTPKAILTKEQMNKVKKYCINDLFLTKTLYKRLADQIALREKMTGLYKTDLRSKSDAQIAETVICKELKIRQWGKKSAPDSVTFKNPNIIQFQNQSLKQMFEKLLCEKFHLSGNGGVKLPDWLKTEKIIINKTAYQMGVGGLHSCEKNQIIRATEDCDLVDFDVASYYPSIILQQKLAPANLGEKFLKVYKRLVDERLRAKSIGDKVKADTLKICVNGSFGKLGSIFSPLYSPDLLIQTTLTGQLALLMLIERFEKIGVRVVSANTDGVVVLVPKDKKEDVEQVVFDFILDTSYMLERTEYRFICSRDVNNYFAVKTDGEVKRKGCFTFGDIAKNPDREIIFDAVINYFSQDMAVRETIENCKDVQKFIMLRTVSGGAVYQNKHLGKCVRYYYSVDGGDLRYKINGNLVPKSTSCRPLIVKNDVLPADLDIERYIVESENMIKKLSGADA